MKSLYVAKRGVKKICKILSFKVSRIYIRYANGKECPYTAIEVDNYQGFGSTYKQLEEPEITIRNLPNDGSDPIFTGTHQELVDKLTENHQSLLETAFQITYEMGFRKFYSGNTMADMAMAIDLAKRFEREHKDTDWDQEDWLSATSEFIEKEINKLKKKE